jgi:hypothetical protein
MRFMTLGLAGLSLFLAAGAMAQTSGAPAAAAPAKASVETTTIGDLLDNPATKAVLEKDLPELVSDPRLPQAKGMTLEEVEPYSEGKIDDAKLAAVQKDLDAAKQ